MQGYQDKHGRLPPAVVHGAEGKPLHSWRVLLLPFIGQEELYRQFKLDEPWDSPHNIQLLPLMPSQYAPPPGKARAMPPFHTICHVFVGPGTAFEGRKGLSLRDDFPDGTSNTILLVEAGKPVPWTQPEELTYDPRGPLPELRGVFPNHFRVAMADGSVQTLNVDIDPQILGAALTRNAGEKPRLER